VLPEVAGVVAVEVAGVELDPPVCELPFPCEAEEFVELAEELLVDVFVELEELVDDCESDGELIVTLLIFTLE
jgi:hypothetical protein